LTPIASYSGEPAWTDGEKRRYPFDLVPAKSDP
jgi:hypothetical protein